MRFSQRIGKTELRTSLLVDTIDDELKNRLWNTIHDNFFAQIQNDTKKQQICIIIWKNFFNYRIDEIPSYIEANVPNRIKSWMFGKANWYEIYDLIEFLSEVDSQLLNINFSEACNYALTKEVAGYRIVNNQVVQITSNEEIIEIENALKNDKWKSVNTHIETALILLADRKNPDFRNSIKESISAVEALCIIITGNKNTTLGKALVEIEKSHKIHGALKSAFSSLYGYTSDSGGIRHALTEDDSIIEFEDAKLMLAIKLFETGKLSLGQSARLAGYSKKNKYGDFREV